MQHADIACGLYQEFPILSARKHCRQQSRCYTVEDLQIMLDISRQSVYTLLKKQEFRWFRVGGRYRISKKSFDDWLDQQG